MREQLLSIEGKAKVVGVQILIIVDTRDVGYELHAVHHVQPFALGSCADDVPRLLERAHTRIAVAVPAPERKDDGNGGVGIQIAQPREISRARAGKAAVRATGGCPVVRAVCDADEIGGEG